VTEVASAWARYPGYAIDLLPLDGVGRARVGDVVVAESDRCLLVRESDHRDQLYFPRADVDATVLVDSSHHTVCPFKGEASYAGLAVGGTSLDDVLWWYPHPMAEVAGIDGYVAFYHDRVEVTASVPFGDGDEATARFPMTASSWPPPSPIRRSAPSSRWPGTRSAGTWSRAGSCWALPSSPPPGRAPTSGSPPRTWCS